MRQAKNGPKTDLKPSPAATVQLPVSTAESGRSRAHDGAFGTKNRPKPPQVSGDFWVRYVAIIGHAVEVRV
jgi:hypothetical protein